jgi:hypothetical protein
VIFKLTYNSKVCVFIQDFLAWTLPAKAQTLVNARGSALQLPKWIPKGLKVLHRSYKCVTYMTLSRSTAWHYLLGGLFPPGQAEALSALIDFLGLIHVTDCDILETPSRADRVTKMRALKAKAIKTLLLFEREFPKTLLVVCMHNLLHFPDMIGRWSNARNYWAFFMER